ncbi:MAG: 3-hydroxyacyl-CoA dehydrogenase PaaC [Gammaproteobacteria bacterium]|nr:MAG: 3-hydroxyacyl-CoA dehydrogenase PaaC [Gammaproteobacteria bacterium]PHR83585.1 MAG: 3-hydroxyacyl-CoA dehydrogenase PaaC [Colwellia sp.]
MYELQTTVTIGVIGAGAMGAGIAQVAASAGHVVYLHDQNSNAITTGINNINTGLKKQVKRGKMTEEDRLALIDRIRPTTNINDLANTGLIVEAIIESLEIKQSLFAKLEEICSSSTILATNTSSLSITSIAAKLTTPKRFVGMHFFNPAPILKLVEVVTGLATDQRVAQTIYNTAKKWGKSPVYTKSSPGFIVNRVARPFYAEGLRVLEEGGASVSTLDTIMRETANFRMGPFELMDLIGHDVNYAVTCSVFNAYYQDPRFKPSLYQQELVNAGFLGCKSGKGFYDYNNDEKPSYSEESIQAIPKNVLVDGDLGVASPLIDLIKNSQLSSKINADSTESKLVVDAVTIVLTNGLSASEVARKSNQENLIVFDLAFDYLSSNRIVLAKAEQASDLALNTAIGFFQALGKKVTVINDIPGLLVMRTVCMLANEAADAVNQNVASAVDVDIAMCKGVNYPKGPLLWADELGVDTVFTVLTNLQESYGEDRYRPSILLRKKYFSRTNFHI